MFFKLGSGSTKLYTLRSILATVSIATGTKGVERSRTRGLDEPPPPCAAHQFWMRCRNVWFGTSSKEAIVCIVAGHVWLDDAPLVALSCAQHHRILHKLQRNQTFEKGWHHCYYYFFFLCCHALMNLFWPHDLISELSFFLASVVSSYNSSPSTASLQSFNRK